MTKKILMMVVLVAMTTGCASPRLRTKWTDPAHRVMILPNGIHEETYVQIETAMMESNKFFIVDRARGFKAIKAEQNMIHRNDVERFDDPEKYAMYGKLYSVGAVIVATEKCMKVPGMFVYVKRIDCRQYLSAIDTSTGEVIVAVEKLVEGDSALESPTWDETVEKFNNAFPKTWEPKQYDKKMDEFRKVAAENALRAKESLAREQNAKEKSE